MSRLAVGLVGAGAWARRAHAPALRDAYGIQFAGVWSRRHGAAGELAADFGTTAFLTFPELLDTCEAVAFAVPPAVQAELAVVAAKAGRAVLLDKPLAADLDGAARLAEAISEAGVPSQLVLTLRYTRQARAFLAAAAAIAAIGGHAAWISAGALGGPFATAWRRQAGAVVDLGPHVIDVMDAALGAVKSVRAHGSGAAWAGLLLAHEGGAVSEISLCHRAPVANPACWFRVYGPEGSAVLDRPRAGRDTWMTLMREFRQTVRDGGGHPLDAQRGLELQRIIDAASRQLES